MGEPAPAWMQELFQLFKRMEELIMKDDAASLKELKETRDRILKIRAANQNSP